MKRIYLDYAATTPVDKRVVKEMAPFLNEKFGNTMSLHAMGQEAKSGLESARKKIAGIINAKPNEIIFTGSATESNNAVLKGVAFAGLASLSGARPHIIISSIEHPCIMETAKWLEKNGYKITRLPVDKFGMVNPKDVEKAIQSGGGSKTILVSVMHASNEIGTIQPIAEIGKICHEKKVLFHTDASQTFGKLPIDVKKMNIDLLTASSHKIYGPKGAGLLYAREGVKIEPLLHGGGQENGMRSSTVNLPAVIGFAKAAEICAKDMKKEILRLSKLRDKLIQGIQKIESVKLNGHPEERLANNVNFSFLFIEGESLVVQLDMHGVECSTGSACSSANLEPSYTLLAIGLSPKDAHGSLRISLGRQTAAKDIDYVLKILPKIVKDLRLMSPFYDAKQ